MNRITIDKKACLKRKDEKLTMPEALMVTAILEGLKKNTIQNMLNREILVVHNGEYMVTQRWAEVMEEIIADSSDLCPKSDSELLQLAIKVQEIFPGMAQKDRNGRPTAYFFRCNKAEIKKALKRFYVTFHDILEGVTDEDILDATRRYVANFAKKGYMGMRLSKYFIIKRPDETDEEGNIHRGLVSDLLTYLENKNSSDGATNIAEDWTTKMI